MNHYPHPTFPFPYRTDTLLENSERSELIIGKLASFASPHSGISLRLAEGQSFGDFTEPKAIVKEPNTEVAKQPRTNGIPFEVRRQAEGEADITETTFIPNRRSKASRRRRLVCVSPHYWGMTSRASPF